MTELVHQASDDQVALAICVGAVAFCGLVMYFSHHVGRLTGHIRVHQIDGESVQPAQHAPAASSSRVMPREKAA